MSIKDLMSKIKPFFVDLEYKIKEHKKWLKIKEDLFVVLIIIFVGLISFGLGKLSMLEKKKIPISIIKTQESLLTEINQTNYQNIDTTQKSKDQPGVIVASKSGTKYYYPWCSGVNRIKEENKVWFLSIEDAKTAGLEPAANCTGLK